MKTFNREGKVLHYKVPTGKTVKSGDLVVVNDIVGVAVTDGAENEVIALAVEGVYLLPVPASVTSIGQGDSVYWDVTAGELSLDPDESPVGIAWEGAVASGEVPVKLNVPTA